jgi:hypothetical protein
MVIGGNMDRRKEGQGEKGEERGFSPALRIKGSISIRKRVLNIRRRRV